VGQDFDYSHGIGFSSHNTANFNREIPEDFPKREEIIRAIFLTQLWEKFYEIAKYGAPELNVGPSLIFDIKDGERALNDASFCVELAEDFINYVETNAVSK
jgi:HEPN domain-containing protein